MSPAACPASLLFCVCGCVWVCVTLTNFMCTEQGPISRNTVECWTEIHPGSETWIYSGVGCLIYTPTVIIRLSELLLIRSFDSCGRLCNDGKLGMKSSGRRREPFELTNTMR